MYRRKRDWSNARFGRTVWDGPPEYDHDEPGASITNVAGSQIVINLAKDAAEKDTPKDTPITGSRPTASTVSLEMLLDPRPDSPMFQSFPGTTLKESQEKSRQISLRHQPRITDISKPSPQRKTNALLPFVHDTADTHSSSSTKEDLGSAQMACHCSKTESQSLASFKKSINADKVMLRQAKVLVKARLCSGERPVVLEKKIKPSRNNPVLQYVCVIMCEYCSYKKNPLS